MTLREAETRIAELEIALENLLELFEPHEDSYCIEVLAEDEEDLMWCELNKDSADMIESSEELLWGGKADAEEA